MVIGVAGMVVGGVVADEAVAVVGAWLWKKSLRPVSSRWGLLLCVSVSGQRDAPSYMTLSFSSSFPWPKWDGRLRGSDVWR